MEQEITNPLKTLSKAELLKFEEAISSNFQITTIKGNVVEDLNTRWFDLYSECLKYAYINHKIITIGYYGEKTYADMVLIMIHEEKCSLK